MSLQVPGMAVLDEEIERAGNTDAFDICFQRALRLVAFPTGVL